ncbi:MAG: glycosyltransferase family 4 protein [Deltaproteobacteria bacterium]|nr:glycosyltransferase family 4 protein [Deltaproteobacteria bacterium]
MRSPSIFYGCQDYFSHKRCARDYSAAIGQAYKLVRDPREADIAILHYEPHMYGQILSEFPYLQNRYVVGFAVWEADILPLAYQQGIALVDEIWTPSRFSLQAFETCHDRVRHVPHVVRREKAFSDADLKAVQSRIRHDSRAVYFLNISKVSDKRKNVHQLLAAFSAVRREMPEARLIIKNYDGTAYGTEEDSVIFVNRFLTPQEINALYYLSDIYVSAHHAEGWGLTMSDAMLFQKPVIGTAYSGNLEFMDSENSFLVDYDLEPIHPEDCFGFFGPDMKWAYPSQDALVDRMITACREVKGHGLEGMIAQAEKRIGSFSLSRVAARVHQAIEAI